jgi:hypothetical protein
VDLLNFQKGQQIFYPKGTQSLDNSPNPNRQHADLEVRDPMEPKKNMTRNCYQFPVIKKLFKDILEQCFERAEKELGELGREMQVESGEELHEATKEKLQVRNVFVDLLESLSIDF